MNPVVLPERPQHKAGLVLLDGQGSPAVPIDPWVPGAARESIRRVLVKEESLFDEGFLAEREELPGHVLVPGAIEGVGDERPITWPCICVGVARELCDVEIRGGDDGAMVVDMRPRRQDAPAV